MFPLAALLATAPVVVDRVAAPADAVPFAAEAIHVDQVMIGFGGASASPAQVNAALSALSTAAPECLTPPPCEIPPSTAVPEPAVIVMVGTGLVLIGLAARHRRRAVDVE